jgi:TonB family protein
LNAFRNGTIACVAACILAFASQTQAKQNNAKPSQVFEDAANRADLRAAASPPFELLAAIKVAIQGTWLNGNYLLLWESKDQWREEVVLPGYERIKVKTADGVWLHRSLDHEIPSVTDLDYALSPAEQLRSGAKLRPGKFVVRRVSGADLECSRATTDTSVQKLGDFARLNDTSEDDFCFDPQQPILKAEVFPKGAAEAPNISSIEYSDFAPFGDKIFPRAIELTNGGNTFLTISVKRIAELVAPKAGEFAPPKDATFMATCAAPEGPKLIEHSLPAYPPLERAAQHTGHVVLYARIAPDGTVHDAKVVFPAAPDFDTAALAAVSKWRYRPATCSGKPTPEETYITVYFELSRM